MNNREAENKETKMKSSPVDFAGNNRIHIALAVSNLSRSQLFYETLLGVRPSKNRPEYVKFEPTDPSVNLTLNKVSTVESPKNSPTHFGVQVKNADAVNSAIERLSTAGLITEIERETTCCYARQDKVWTSDPDGNRWEIFFVLDPAR